MRVTRAQCLLTWLKIRGILTSGPSSACQGRGCDVFRPFLLVLSLLAALPAHAGLIVVDRSGGGDSTTISEGVSAAVAGDTVLVMPGTYTGALNRNIETHHLTIKAYGGPGVTTIDCEYQGYAFDAWNTSLSGFTILHCIGLSQAGYGAVYISNGEMLDCVLEDNDCMGLVTYSANTVTNCVFRNNTDYGAMLGQIGRAHV